MMEQICTLYGHAWKVKAQKGDHVVWVCPCCGAMKQTGG